MGNYNMVTDQLKNELVVRLSPGSRRIHDEEEAHARVCAALARLETLPHLDRDALFRIMDALVQAHQARVQENMEGLAQAELAMKIIELAEELEPSGGPNITAAEAIAILKWHGEEPRNGG